MKKSITAFAAGMLLSGAALASTHTLTFDGSIACGPTAACGDGTRIQQSYGDVAGIVDVSTFDLVTSNPVQSLKWWDGQYNDLRGVVWSGGGDGAGQSHARIEIKALNGGLVTLNSMDFGAWANATRNSNIVVTAIGGGAPLFSYSGAIGAGSTTHASFAPGVSANGGLWIDWYDTAYNVGIDNVAFTVAVPEPETYALLLAGLGLMGGVARRRAARR